MKKVLAFVLMAGLALMGCQKEFSIENGQSANLTGAWEFKDSINTLYAGNPVQYYIDDTSNTASANMVYTGATANLSAQISIEVFFPTGVATIGSYQSANGEVTFLYQTNTGKYFKVDAFSGQFSTENITVNIIAISDSSVTGTFSGRALDTANRLVTIKEGKFSYRKRSAVITPTTSAGTFGSALDTCTGAVLSGIYKKGVALTAANTVRLTVNVTTIGTYSIFSDTLKGVYFGGTSSFTATGVQTVTLPGVGTPTDSAAALRFRVRYGTSTCTFLVKIDTGSAVVVVPPTGDYFPLTTNSNWSYDTYDQAGTLVDSAYQYVTGTFKTVGTNSFNIFLDSNGDSSFYRKNSGIYYAAIDLNDFLGFGGVQITQMLKDNVAVNNTWNDTYSITLPGSPFPISGRVDYTLLAKAVPATVNALSFQDVIKVKSVYSYGITGVPFTTAITREIWYARGGGIIYEKDTDNIANAFQEIKVRRLVINP